MSEEKIIVTQTAVSIIGNTISIRSYYEQDTGINTLLAFICDNVTIVDGISFIEGELGIQMNNYPAGIDYEINENGELIIFTEDATNYSIDSDGNLIYTN